MLDKVKTKVQGSLVFSRPEDTSHSPFVLLL